MSARTKIVISDTHIGAGGEPEGNKLEDFISDAAFVAWVHELMAESNRAEIDIDFIINGDWIEFLQIPDVKRFEPHTPYPAAVYSQVDEAAALRRLEIVHEWHPSIFLGLADFLHADSPRRRLIVLFGNHDPELVYPAVQERIRQMLGAVGAEADLVHFGPRIYCEHGVYAEHGNAYTESVDRFRDPDHPFDPDHPDRIERPSGSHFVTNFFNRVEWQRPWVDGVQPLTSLLFYALAFEPVFALKVLKALLVAAPGILLSIAATPTPESGAPEAGSLPMQREQLLEELASPELEAAMAERLTSDPDFVVDFADRVEQAMMEVGAAPAPPPGVARAASTLPPEVRARDIAQQYGRALEEAGERIVKSAPGENIEVVLFGHIHQRCEKRLPSGALYLNTGTWIWNGDFSDKPDQVWQDLIHAPDKYSRARELTYARIDYDDAGKIVSAGLKLVGEPSAPPSPPGPLPQPGWWTRLLLSVRDLFRRLFLPRRQSR